MSAPRILAIDPSLTSTGVCLPDGTCATIRSRSLGWLRLDEIACACELAMASDGHPVDLVVIEECIVGRAVHVESMWLHGILRKSAALLDVPYVDIHPSRRQKYACGDQKNRDKDAVQYRAWKGGSPATNNDEADAWWLWVMAMNAYRTGPEEQTLYQREVLAAIDWPEINGHKPVWTAPKKTRKKAAA